MPQTFVVPDLDVDSGNDIEIELQTGDAPPSFGKCPVCGKPLQPRDRITGVPRAPKPGKDYESRAKCGHCGTILYYIGGPNYEWGILKDSDLTPEDRHSDSMDAFLSTGGV